MGTILRSRRGGTLPCLNFPLFNQEVAPLTFIAEFRTPHSAVSEVEDQNPSETHMATGYTGPCSTFQGSCRTTFHYFRGERMSSGRVASAHCTVTWGSGCHVRLLRARSLL
jgi:hypothetical protein